MDFELVLNKENEYVVSFNIKEDTQLKCSTKVNDSVVLFTEIYKELLSEAVKRVELDDFLGLTLSSKQKAHTYKIENCYEDSLKILSNTSKELYKEFLEVDKDQHISLQSKLNKEVVSKYRILYVERDGLDFINIKSKRF